MGDVHQLLLRFGLDAARAQAATRGERQAIDAAASVLAEEETRLGITHAGFAMTSLPHKRIEAPVWRRDGGRTTLLVEAGHERDGALIGVPYGSIARLILLVSADRGDPHQFARGRARPVDEFLDEPHGAARRRQDVPARAPNRRGGFRRAG